MPWIDEDRYLTQAEMENNANIIIPYYRSLGFSKEAIAAILGNMQAESTLSPALNEVGGGGGYGLVQWTPLSNLTDACNILGLSPYTSGDVQIQVIVAEVKNENGVAQWYTNESFITPYYPSGATSDMINVSGNDFLFNTLGWTADKLAVLFMVAYERPAYDPAVNHVDQRKANALFWLNFMGGNTFIPRLTDEGILNNPMWYADNPFWQAGYGLPNCTCYCWGRWYEITGKPPTLPLGDANTWYAEAQALGLKVGSTPQLGAILCTWYSDGGHVAVVEEINGTQITTSNSGYPSTFFWTEKLHPPYVAPWTPPEAYFQGFIYLDQQPIPPDPTKRRKMPFIYYLKNRRILW